MQTIMTMNGEFLSHEDRHLFEMLILEGAQAGLSWETILKEQGLSKAFHHFDPRKVAQCKTMNWKRCVNNDKIIRNRLKIYAARQNAIIFLKIQKEFGSFDRYVWSFVGLSLLRITGKV